MKRSPLSRVFLGTLDRDAAAPTFVLLIKALLFDMRLLVEFTAVSGPQMFHGRSGHDQSSMRLSSMRFAPHFLSLRAERLVAQSGYRALMPMGYWGRPSCDGTPLEFRIVDLIAQHDVRADE